MPQTTQVSSSATHDLRDTVQPPLYRGQAPLISLGSPPKHDPISLPRSSLLSQVVCTFIPSARNILLTITTTTTLFSQQNLMRFPHPLPAGSASCPFQIELTISSSRTLYHPSVNPSPALLHFLTYMPTLLDCTQGPCLPLEPSTVSGTQSLGEKYMLNEQTKNLSSENGFNLSAKVLSSTQNIIHWLC